MNVHKKILEKNGRLDSQYAQQQQSHAKEEEYIQNKQNSVQIQFNASYNNIRCTSNIFPQSKQTFIDAKIPFAIMIQPYGQSVQDGFVSVNNGGYPIIRCASCRAYLNPFMNFIDDFDYLRCNLCNLITQIGFNTITKENSNQRIELTLGSYDIKAGQEYQARPPMAPAYFFMIDVSTKSEALLGIIGQVMNELMISEQFNERTLFGFLTFDSSIHLYNFNSKLKQAQMYVLTDDNELPMPGEFLFNLQDSKDIIVGFLNSLGQLFSKPLQKATQFMEALKISQKLIKENGAKLIILTSSPIKELSIVDNGKQQQQYLHKSKSVLTQITESMYFQFICPSIFVVPNNYMNIYTINQLATYLNGDVFYYDDPTVYTTKFRNDLKEVLSRDYAWESVFRVRTSVGWKIKYVYGNYVVKTSDLLSINNCDDQKVLVYELELTEPNLPYDNLYIQTALLYTSLKSERRIRVHNYCIPLSNSVKTIYSHIDQSTLAMSIFKMALFQINSAKNLIPVKEYIISTIRSIFYNCKLYNISLDQMYAYSLGIMKSIIFNYSYDQQSILTDYVNYFRIVFQYIHFDELVTYLVPQLYNVSSLQEHQCVYDDEGQFAYPEQLSLVFSELSSGGLYLMDCGYCLILYICIIHDPTQLVTLFDAEYDTKQNEDNLQSHNGIYTLISQLRYNKFTKYAPLYIVKQGCKSIWEDVFMQNLIYEDFNPQYRMDYNRFVSYIG
ncbi:unnamed protein product (macronuclear) [Paramecium tetraurelia]|uniref:Uncharacterized protein n=1 Tax=Paramecium tetraurelia TaxID=5888 RepID=A0CHY5_PARTE|nr:uncharacterized protein GSPATT00038504001 [Paramecium tetraurelia]CAK70402.1 unnamed protein product [Paramecium tetraurelia]|eukprot:XP_001437799.1 hypothetical protein (macronuclear) [Paramecium tetraurelia strain d4-2]